MSGNPEQGRLLRRVEELERRLARQDLMSKNLPARWAKAAPTLDHIALLTMQSDSSALSGTAAVLTEYDFEYSGGPGWLSLSSGEWTFAESTYGYWARFDVQGMVDRPGAPTGENQAELWMEFYDEGFEAWGGLCHVPLYLPNNASVDHAINSGFTVRGPIGDSWRKVRMTAQQLIGSDSIHIDNGTIGEEQVIVTLFKPRVPPYSI